MSAKMTSELRDSLRGLALDSLYWPNRAPIIVEKDLPLFYRAAADEIGVDAHLLYLEFGVAHGKSMSEMLKIFTNCDSRFFGFDSFIGLPEDWLMHKVGGFSNQGKPPRLDDTRVDFIQGWFQNTVPVNLCRIANIPHRKVLVHIDSDLYSSSLFLLSQLWSVFHDYYFIFDDFIHDEVVALADFMRAFPCRVEFIVQTRGGGAGPNPDQVFGRMIRTSMHVD